MLASDGQQQRPSRNKDSYPFIDALYQAEASHIGADFVQGWII
jgi:hypothetical protein